MKNIYLTARDGNIGFLGKSVINFGKPVLNQLLVLLTFIKYSTIILYKTNNFYVLCIVTYVDATENEHRISRVSLSEAMNIIYISTNPADLSDHMIGNTNDRPTY